MGTNYYEHVDCCDKCNRPVEILHIGKSSRGWPFSIHVIPELGLNSWLDWCKRLETSKIFDEYDREVVLIDLHDLIEKKRIHKDEEHVLDKYRSYPSFCQRDPITGDQLCSGEFS